MRASEARKILRCSYTTLHNYLKQGKLLPLDVGNKTVQYDDDSVMKLATSLHGDVEPKFKIVVVKRGVKTEFILEEHILDRVLNYIIQEVKHSGDEEQECSI